MGVGLEELGVEEFVKGDFFSGGKKNIKNGAQSFDSYALAFETPHLIGQG